MSLSDTFKVRKNNKEVKKLRHRADEIMKEVHSIQTISDDELKEKSLKLKEQVSDATLDNYIVPAFALVYEAIRRTLDLELFPEQLIGGIVLHQGKIAELKTGEGKSITCYAPAYLNALTGHGVHIVTVNDYLAKRDADQASIVFEKLGLSVGCILNQMTQPERKEQYLCDITYITNNELGFDYLRDNMVTEKDKMVQRGLIYTIIDEVDSVLIDEARTPLIISGVSGKSTKIYELCDILAKQMERGEAEEVSTIDILNGAKVEETGDFVVMEKEKIVTLTEQGVKKVESFFHIDNLADPENLEIQHNIILALRANNLMHIDQDYVVKDNEVLIVDEFTGRIMPGRRFSDGLHQAIEAKEHVTVKGENMTMATITFQNFFNKYKKKSGMTGTAMTELQEFENIYGLDVVAVPTHKPVIREDCEDAVYKTQKEKYNAIINSICEAHATGQPILVGTVNIDTSELLSRMLTKRGIPHNVLNAKFHEQEANIVADAGKHGAVTIATNMAGRGTDIKLDEEARQAGGLYVIGTERHKSRRIDNQLRGRSGRQGDPGKSKFYISMEDDVLKLFGSDKMLNLCETLGVEDNEELQHKSLSSLIEKAQKHIEDNNFGVRKNLLNYDDVMNAQREIIYAERMRVLNGEDMHETLLDMSDDVMDNLVNETIPDNVPASEWDMTSFNRKFSVIFPINNVIQINEDVDKKYNKNSLKTDLHALGRIVYEEKAKEFPFPEHFGEFERLILLKVIDRHWMRHIDDMDHFKQGIGLVSYGQKDPVVEFRIQGFQMFDRMIADIKTDTIGSILHAKTETERILNKGDANGEEKQNEPE